MATRKPGERAGLTRDRVLDAARAVIADSGLGGLTMRALARRLGVNPNAVYSHLDSKSALLDALLDDALASIREPPLPCSPADAVQHLMVATFDVLLTQGDLVPLYLARRTAPGPCAEQLAEATRKHLVAAGLGDEAAREALGVLVVNAIGFAAFANQTGGVSGLIAGRSPGAVRASYIHGLHWLLAGILRPLPAHLPPKDENGL